MFAKKNKKIVFLLGFFLLVLFIFPFSFGENGAFVAHAQTNPTSANPDPGLSGWDVLWSPIVSLLVGIQKLLGMFIEVSFNLITSFIDVKIVRGMLTSTAVTETWTAVRDVCNLAFILTLLFSAFATIFHIEKYHIKTIIVKLVLMALLINFSLPITRFVIDTGNVPMYYLAQVLMGPEASGIGSQIAKEANVLCAILPSYGKCGILTGATDKQQLDKGYAELIGSIVLLFLFAITMFSVAILFAIRTIALTILLIFSPLGFVGIAVPALNKYATQFWETLIQYVFFGPAMLFMIVVSVKMMAALNGLSANGAGVSVSQGFVGSIMMMSVPIVILWMAMIVAQKSGVAGASIVVEQPRSLQKHPFLECGNIPNGKLKQLQNLPIASFLVIIVFKALFEDGKKDQNA